MNEINLLPLELRLERKSFLRQLLLRILAVLLLPCLVYGLSEYGLFFLQRQVSAMEQKIADLQGQIHDEPVGGMDQESQREAARLATVLGKERWEITDLLQRIGAMASEKITFEAVEACDLAKSGSLSISGKSVDMKAVGEFMDSLNQIGQIAEVSLEDSYLLKADSEVEEPQEVHFNIWCQLSK
ncbi:hypothetical protein H1S01_10420 [Heliobacterium chlorum]|uniref:Fimbrial assembly protein (PilN) n=1 Tax=Heliobacterium chlorum TaxID=2698 RepID=A0ABR7T2D1_HELCL|nr:hypothetical protein [Heliobacterium chlorum]MBC9784924.1 hypothetical protein [Heliobacterium chlorum]